jgi:hypothetical protein
MFSIEHDFDATVVTLMDEGESPLQEDVVLTAFEEVVQVEQYDQRSDSIQKISISMAQLRELAAALNLPEGVYRIDRPTR